MYSFSVIIPLYNKEEFILRTVQSVLNQSYQNFEIVVVDDGSSDNGVEKLLELKNNKIRIVEQENAGVSAARNRGIKEAKYEYCAFLDADDEWKPNFLGTIVKLIESYPKAKAFCTAYVMQVGDSITRLNFVPFKHKNNDGMISNYFYSRIKGDSLISTSSACVEKNVLIELGGFVVGEKLGEDQDLWIKIALKYEIAFSHNEEAIYNIGLPGSACKVNLPNEEIIYIKTLQFLLKNNKIPQNLITDVQLFIVKELINISRINILNNNAIEGRNIILRIPYKGFFMKKIFWLIASYIPFKVFEKIKSIINNN